MVLTILNSDLAVAKLGLSSSGRFRYWHLVLEVLLQIGMTNESRSRDYMIPAFGA